MLINSLEDFKQLFLKKKAFIHQLLLHIILYLKKKDNIITSYLLIEKLELIYWQLICILNTKYNKQFPLKYNLQQQVIENITHSIIIMVNKTRTFNYSR